MIDFVPHRAAWTHEKSTRFRHELFSLMGGEKNDVHDWMSGSLIRFARANGSDLGGQVLELGSRSGPLDGAHTTLSSETYSTAFVVDTIEHLPDDELRVLIAELHRALRPDGSLVVVAPNEEKLQIGETVCPDCGCMFHRLQHVRSWTDGSLAAFMSECGFATVASTPWYLDQRWWKSRLITTAARTLGKRLPNLIYVGRKRVVR